MHASKHPQQSISINSYTVHTCTIYVSRALRYYRRLYHNMATCQFLNSQISGSLSSPTWLEGTASAFQFTISQYHNLVSIIAHLAQETCAAQSQYHNSQYESLKDLAVPTYHACYRVLNHK